MLRHNVSRTLAALLLVLAALALSACAPGNSVRLLYSPPDAAVLPDPSAPRVTVVMFEDKRPVVQVGERKDGTSFVAASTVSDWVSRSLADELARQGLQVSFALTPEQARAGGPDYIVTGVVNEVWLKELKTTEFSTSMKLAVSVSDYTKVLYTEHLSGGQSKQVIPASDVVEKLLAETLRDVLQPAARKIQSTVKK